MLLAEGETTFNPLGDDLLPWILLALGGALLVGNLLAILRPPPAPTQQGDLRRAPVGRSLFMAAIGLVATVWSLGSLIAR